MSLDLNMSRCYCSYVYYVAEVHTMNIENNMYCIKATQTYVTNYAKGGYLPALAVFEQSHNILFILNTENCMVKIK